MEKIFTSKAALLVGRKWVSGELEISNKSASFSSGEVQKPDRHFLSITDITAEIMEMRVGLLLGHKYTCLRLGFGSEGEDFFLFESEKEMETALSCVHKRQNEEKEKSNAEFEQLVLMVHMEPEQQLNPETQPEAEPEPSVLPAEVEPDHTENTETQPEETVEATEPVPAQAQKPEIKPEKTEKIHAKIIRLPHEVTARQMVKEIAAILAQLSTEKAELSELLARLRHSGNEQETEPTQPDMPIDKTAHSANDDEPEKS